MCTIEEDTQQGRMLSKAFGISVQGDCHFLNFYNHLYSMEPSAAQSSKRTFFLSAFFVLAALMVLMDFAIPGKVAEDHIVRIQRQVQKHNNAARGFHYSHRLVTQHRAFSVSKKVAKRAEAGAPIVYSVSRVFDEVNWCRIPYTDARSYYSLRWLSGVLLPLLTLAVMFFEPRYKGAMEMGIVVFVLKVLLLADVLFLLFL